MCKNSAIIVSEKKEETKKWCSSDCKKCSFNKVFVPPETDRHSWLPDTVKNIEALILSSDK